jgi:spore cortex formation protein SpoVR/YcgB (stage V sporulation)
MTSCIHYLANKNTSTKHYGVLTIEEGFISFVIFQNDQPISCIQNEFQTVEDILYFVTYTIQNLSLAELHGKIEVVNLMRDSIYEKLRDGIASLSIQPKLIWEENPNFKNTIINICV